MKIRVSPGTVGFVRPTNTANLCRGGFDGQVVSGQQALRRCQKHLEDLEATGNRPRYLLTLTLPENLSPEDWNKVKSSFRTQFSRLLGKHDGGCFWWQGFQTRSQQPHLHVLVDVSLERAVLLEWALGAWAKALGRAIPEEAVDLKHRSNFNYPRSNRTMRQALAPARARWGQWQGFMGRWATVVREAKQTTLEAEFDPAEAEGLLEEVAQQARRLPLPDWLVGRLERFARGWHRAFWVAKRLWAGAARVGKAAAEGLGELVQRLCGGP